MGLALVASRARRVTDGMLVAAAHALAENSPALHDASAPVLPVLTDVRRVAVEMAFAIGMAAQQEGIAPKTTPEELRARVEQSQWSPEYSSLHNPERQEVAVLQ